MTKRLRVTELSSKELQALLDKLWTTQDLMRAFKRTAMCIYQWRIREDLPAVVVTGAGRNAVRFIPAEVRAWAKTTGKRIYKI